MRSEPFVFKNSNSKYFKLRYYDNGNPKTITTKQENEIDANKWAKKFLAEPIEQDKSKLSYKLSTFIEDVFLPDKELDKKTILNFWTVMRELNKVVPEKFINQYTKDDINKFIYKKKGTVSDHTLKSYLVNLSVILNYAFKEKYIKYNPILKAKPVKTKKVKIRYFTDEDFNRLISVMDNQLIKDITYFAVYTGMRASEILRLKKENVYLEKKIILNYQKKVDEFNVISIAKDVFEIVKRNYNQNEEYLFVYEFKKTKISVVELSKRFKEFVRLAELHEDYCFKSLRKTFGSILWQSSVTLDKVSHLLGHSDTRITKKHYAQLGKGYDNTVDLIKLLKK